MIKRALYNTKHAKQYILYTNILGLLLCTMIIGCDEESPFEPQNSVPVEIPGSLSALHFPTAVDCSWKYVSADGEHEYTTKITGARNVGGIAAKVMENDSDIPVDQIALLINGLPIRMSLFTKDLDSYTEHGSELLIDFQGNTFFQRYSPKRVIWSFPLYEGKEWEVSKLRLIPEITFTRKVISDNGVLTVPAGTFRNVYYVEEYISIADLDTGEETPSKYWLAPDVGVIKYEYIDPILNTTQTYELSDFKNGR